MCSATCQTKMLYQIDPPVSAEERGWYLTLQ